MKLLSRRLSRLSRQSKPVQAANGRSEEVSDAGDEAAVMKKQMVTDFSCLSCDKKLLFTSKECVISHRHRHRHRYY